MLDALGPARRLTLAVFWLVAASACGSEDRPPIATTGGMVTRGANSEPPRVQQAGSACVTGTTFECRVYLEGYSRPVCFEGIQRCVDGVWSDCERPGSSSDSDGGSDSGAPDAGPVD